MSVLVDILLVLSVTLGSLLVLVLIAPLHLRAGGEVDGEALHASYALRVRWALGILGLDLASGERPTLRLFGIPIARFTPDKRRTRRKDKKREKRAKSEKSEETDARRGPGLVWFFRQRHHLWRLALRMLATLHLRGRVSGAVGMPEPDDSVWLALALNQLDARLPPGTLDLEVDYSDAVLDLEGRLTSWLIPGHVLVVGLALYFFSDLGRALRGRITPLDPRPQPQSIGSASSSHGDLP